MSDSAQTKATTMTPEKAASLMRGATYASVAVAIFLIIAKVGAWLITGSVTMLSSLVDSLMDAFASILNLIAVRQALQPADSEHRFGHGKAEPLAGLGQAAFISGSAVFLLIQAGERLANPRPITNDTVGYAVMGLSIVLTLALVFVQRSVIRRTGSLAISADSLHYKGDLLANASVIVSLVLSAQFGLLLADPLFAIAIAAFIVWGAWQIAAESLDMLMDKELPDDDRQRIRAIALAHPGVKDVHDMRTRASGPRAFIQLHLVLDRELTFLRAHAIADAVEADIMKYFPNAEIIIHEDPEGVPERHRLYS
jgi:ferrous-iron efflux pump FieF